MLNLSLAYVVSLMAIALALATKDESSMPEFYIGTGISDMTGPAAQMNFMGYAVPKQVAHGIHMRLRSRAFIIAEPPNNEVDFKTAGILQKQRLRVRSSEERSPGDPNDSDVANLDPDKAICFVSIDAGMGSDLLTLRVLKRLEDLLPLQKNGKRICRLENLSISGTHTHSAPAGFIQYTLYQITSLGFSPEVMEAYTEGIARSIQKAYYNLSPGSIALTEDLLFDANINRSPTSYSLNPAEERDSYADIGNTDKTMLQLRFDDQKGHPIGLINWFAVHGTSMNSSNVLISGDNKGYASYLMEKEMNPGALPGNGTFVAAFASTNLGDVSPNTAGPRCIDTGEPCDAVTSTCNGNTLLCIASGPGQDMFDSTEIIGRKQFDQAKKMMSDSGIILKRNIDFRHSFVDMSSLTVVLEDGSNATTCPAALGYSFAGGTTDGPGAFPFQQGTNSSNPFWNLVGGFLSIPSKEQVECQSPKPILLNTGKVNVPYRWDPNSIPISIFRIGNLFVLNVPSELTTMAGRRLRSAVKSLLVDHGCDDPTITIAGLANSYTHYVTTFEEYAGQRYEAASTLYGPHTLSAYMQEFKRLAADMMLGKDSDTDAPPADMGRRQLSLIPPVVSDSIGVGFRFGSVAVQPRDVYTLGRDSVFVSFRSANPRNNQRLESTFLTVDKLLDDGSWATKYVDSDWCTRYYWKGSEVHGFGISFAEIEWHVPSDAEQGIYRICHHGTRATFLGDFQWVALYAPDWVTMEMLGSTFAGFLLQAIQLARYFSPRFAAFLDRYRYPSLKDFSGCSRSFLVKIP